MGIIRLILIAAAIWLVWRVVKQTLLAPPRDDKHSNEGTSAENTDTPSRMLKCEQCGVHVPEADAFSARGHHFCSNAHQQAWLEHHDAD